MATGCYKERIIIMLINDVFRFVLAVLGGSVNDRLKNIWTGRIGRGVLSAGTPSRTIVCRHLFLTRTPHCLVYWEHLMYLKFSAGKYVSKQIFVIKLCTLREPGRLSLYSDYGMGLRGQRVGVRVLVRGKIFLLSTLFRPTQLPIEWVRCVKRPRHELPTHLQIRQRKRIRGSINPLPHTSLWHGP
jgi:hypothetical protein